ncbi:MAG: hypothetical protein CMP86_09620 [Gammaproteobacteria bacterium]|nr:hypothetical protein [Gammaproteobacteria bacterium]
MRLASVDSYLPDAGDLSQACIPLGFFTAFCLQHQLLSPEVEQMHRDTVIQCRLQEGPVSALFVALGAELEDRHLSPAGQAFAHRVLPTYSDCYCELFGEDSWQIKDDWENYQRMADVLVRDLYGQPSKPVTSWFDTVIKKVVGLWR